MSHPRETIRKTVRDILLNGNTIAGKQIHINKMVHPDDLCLPEVIIYTESENISQQNEASRTLKRLMNLNIEVLTSAVTENQNNDNLDQLTWQIEKLLADDDDWNQTVSNQILTSVRFEFRETGTIPIAACLMTYEVKYFTTLPESIDTQVAANLLELTTVQGNGPEFGWDIGVSSPHPNGVIDAELFIDATV